MTLVSPEVAAPAPAAAPAVASREGFIDSFRGLLIAHMALDHASLMFNSARAHEELWGRPVPVHADVWQFLTRFTGVPVAPAFCLMAGFMVAWTSVGRRARGVSESEITRRLVIRGLVLIAADTILGGLPRALQGYYSFVVLSSIGVSLIALAFARRWPVPALSAIAGAVLLLHPLLDVSGLPVFLRAVLHEPVRTGPIRSLYPIIPWIGLVFLGFVVGRDAVGRCDRERFWLASAAVLAALFFVVRLPAGYGNAYPHQGIASIEFWSFAKYPPDLPFLSFALAVTFLSLAVLHRICAGGVPRPLAPFLVLGRVPFFFYVTHFYVLGIGRALTPFKTGLLGAYVAWLLLLAAMVPVCAWYYRKKRDRPNFVTRYL